MKIDIENLTFIPNDEVPIKIPTKWDSIFSSIPKGKSLVLKDSQANPDSMRGALIRRKRQGKFKNLRLVVRGKKGNRTAYLMNEGTK